jgi:tungstate transport system ATP-binding protein
MSSTPCGPAAMLRKAGARSTPSSGASVFKASRIGRRGGFPGGEQQRLALARALATDPQVLFLDEPTASLDPAATKIVEEIIQFIAGSGVKIVMATHDLGQARRLAGDVVLLARGRIMEHASAATLFANPQSPEAAAFLRGDLLV